MVVWKLQWIQEQRALPHLHFLHPCRVHKAPVLFAYKMLHGASQRETGNSLSAHILGLEGEASNQEATEALI